MEIWKTLDYRKKGTIKMTNEHRIRNLSVPEKSIDVGLDTDAYN